MREAARNLFPGTWIMLGIIALWLTTIFFLLRADREEERCERIKDVPGVLLCGNYWKGNK